MSGRMKKIIEFNVGMDNPMWVEVSRDMMRIKDEIASSPNDLFEIEYVSFGAIIYLDDFDDSIEKKMLMETSWFAGMYRDYAETGVSQLHLIGDFTTQIKVEFEIV